MTQIKANPTVRQALETLDAFEARIDAGKVAFPQENRGFVKIARDVLESREGSDLKTVTSELLQEAKNQGRLANLLFFGLAVGGALGLAVVASLASALAIPGGVGAILAFGVGLVGSKAAEASQQHLTKAANSVEQIAESMQLQKASQSE